MLQNNEKEDENRIFQSMNQLNKRRPSLLPPITNNVNEHNENHKDNRSNQNTFINSIGLIISFIVKIELMNKLNNHFFNYLTLIIIMTELKFNRVSISLLLSLLHYCFYVSIY